MVTRSIAPEVRSAEHSAGDQVTRPLPNESRRCERGPFVINLRASTAPITVAQLECAIAQRAQVYQIKRLEDGRARYRLRLGPFVSADEVDAILEKVRVEYPGALAAIAGADDLQAMVALKSIAPAAPILTTAVNSTVPVSVEPAVQGAPVLNASLGTKPAMPMNTTPVVKTPSAVSASTVVSTAPVVSIAPVVTSAPSLSTSPVSKAAPARSAAPLAKPPSAVNGAPAKRITSEVMLESTQTLRPLTTLELEVTEGSARWYVIQLSVSQTAFDPDALPNLDIFSLYRLYSVSVSHEGRLVHSLRLGFFGDDMGARAVANYLAAYFDNPSIKRVSVAERERFAEQGVEARKDVGETGRHATIEITDALVIRELRRAQ